MKLLRILPSCIFLAKYNIIDKETNPVIKEPGYELGFDKVNAKRFFLKSRHPFFNLITDT